MAIKSLEVSSFFAYDNRLTRPTNKCSQCHRAQRKHSRIPFIFLARILFRRIQNDEQRPGGTSTIFVYVRGRRGMKFSMFLASFRFHQFGKLLNFWNAHKNFSSSHINKSVCHWWNLRDWRCRSIFAKSISWASTSGVGDENAWKIGPMLLVKIIR